MGLLDSYSDLEAAAYLVGCNPDVVNQHTVAAFPSSRKAKRFNEILEALPHAVNIRNSEGRILPERLIGWAEIRRIPVAAGLRRVIHRNVSGDAVSHSQLKQQLDEAIAEIDRLRAQLAPLNPKEKKSLQIIALTGAVKQYGYRGKNSPAPATIASDAQMMGMSITAPVVSQKLENAMHDLEFDWSTVER